jgi:NADH-quinone oxidoreductase subunit A
LSSAYTSQFELWPLLVYAGLVLLTVGGMIALSYFLGQRHKEKQTDTIYESGIKSTGDARVRFPVHFYIVAMFFVIFDLETAFIISWAISFRELGWGGYIAAAIFIGVLLVVLLYELRIGALDFGPKGKELLKVYHQRLKDKSLKVKE